MDAETIIRTLCSRLQAWCKEQKIPEDHGYEHYMAVYRHALAALSYEQLTSTQSLAVLLAALLHDVDDRKIKQMTLSMALSLPPPVEGEGKKETPYPIAARFLAGLTKDKELIDLTLSLIDEVSASKNGNKYVEPDWKIIPRAADRIEALGMEGIHRCYDCTVRMDNPIVTPNTPLPVTETELLEVMRTRPFDLYIKGGGKSASMIDHFYDKLFHLGAIGTTNPYLLKEACKRLQVMKEWLFKANRFLSLLKIKEPIYGSKVAFPWLSPPSHPL